MNIDESQNCILFNDLFYLKNNIPEVSIKTIEDYGEMFGEDMYRNAFLSNIVMCIDEPRFELEDGDDNPIFKTTKFNNIIIDDQRSKHIFCYNRDVFYKYLDYFKNHSITLYLGSVIMLWLNSDNISIYNMTSTENSVALRNHEKEFLFKLFVTNEQCNVFKFMKNHLGNERCAIESSSEDIDSINFSFGNDLYQNNDETIETVSYCLNEKDSKIINFYKLITNSNDLKRSIVKLNPKYFSIMNNDMKQVLENYEKLLEFFPTVRHCMFKSCSINGVI